MRINKRTVAITTAIAMGLFLLICFSIRHLWSGPRSLVQLKQQDRIIDMIIKETGIPKENLDVTVDFWETTVVVADPNQVNAETVMGICSGIVKDGDSNVIYLFLGSNRYKFRNWKRFWHWF